MKRGHTKHWVWHPAVSLQLLSILWVPSPVLGPMKTGDYDIKPMPQFVDEPMCEGVVCFSGPRRD